jgi:hypothetical protein
MALTPLHRALGLPSSPLEFSMLLKAIGQGLQERDDLDWKKELPNRQNPAAAVEFAKDIAALVNNGGGLIVYGVAESASAAATIESVDDWDESAEQRLRSWAYTLIQPPVHGLEFMRLAGPSSSGEGEARAVALSVPASPDTPHFVIQKGSIRAPRRYGSHTVDMSEREIEQAYRRRFEDRRNNDRALAELLEQVMLGVDRERSIWMTAAARPTHPRPSYAGRIGREDAQAMLAEFARRNPFLKQGHGLTTTNLNPRPGYRKWRSTEIRQFFDRVIVDIHDDGSVALAMEAKEAAIEGFDAGTDVHVMDAQSLPAHIGHLARAVADRLSMSGEFEISITMSSPSGSPIFIRTFEPVVSFMRDRDQLAPIHRFQSVTGVLEAVGPESEALATVHDLALDIMNQGGSHALGTMYLNDLA